MFVCIASIECQCEPNFKLAHLKLIWCRFPTAGQSISWSDELCMCVLWTRYISFRLRLVRIGRILCLWKSSQRYKFKDKYTCVQSMLHTEDQNMHFTSEVRTFLWWWVDCGWSSVMQRAVWGLLLSRPSQEQRNVFIRQLSLSSSCALSTACQAFTNVIKYPN